MNNKYITIAVVAVIIVVLILVFRGCKQINLKQKSNDKRTEVFLEIEKQQPE